MNSRCFVLMAVMATLSCGGSLGQEAAPRKDSDVAKLKQDIEQLKAENAKLREENRLLRQLVANAAPTEATVNRQPQAPDQTQPAPDKTVKAAAGPADEVDTGYWLTTSSHKRHNKTCRFYKTSRGRPCKPDEGIPCKICGG